VKLLLVGSTELVGRNGSPSGGSRRRVDDVVAPRSRAGRLRRYGSTKNSRNCRAGNHNCRLTGKQESHNGESQAGEASG
jgi:hypothetical protein